MGLSSLPTPTNDFEIVVPETEDDTEMKDDANTWIEDQADIDQQSAEAYQRKREEEFKRSQEVPEALDYHLSNTSTIDPSIISLSIYVSSCT